MPSRVLFSARGKFALRGVLLFFALVALVVAPPAFAKKSKGGKKDDHGQNSQGQNNQGNNGRGHSQTRLASRYAKQEIQILKKMIDQRQAAINLALIGDIGTTGTVAIAASSSSATLALVNGFCKDYALRMQTEQTQLKTWLQTWYNVTYSPKKRGGDGEELLGRTGDAFTRGLLDQMIGVHMSGVAFEKQAVKRGYEPELVSFAAKAISTDLGEVARIKSWLRQFPKPRESHHSRGSHED